MNTRSKIEEAVLEIEDPPPPRDSISLEEEYKIPMGICDSDWEVCKDWPEEWLDYYKSNPSEFKV